MEERPEQPENENAASPEEDDSPQGVAENVCEAGKAVSITIVYGIVALLACLGFGIGVFFLYEVLREPVHPFMARYTFEGFGIFIQLFALLFFLAVVGYAFRKFSLKNVQKGMYWFMGVLVAVMIVATMIVTLNR